MLRASHIEYRIKPWEMRALGVLANGTETFRREIDPLRSSRCAAVEKHSGAMKNWRVSINTNDIGESCRATRVARHLSPVGGSILFPPDEHIWPTLDTTAAPFHSRRAENYHTRREKAFFFIFPPSHFGPFVSLNWGSFGNRQPRRCDFLISSH